MKPDLEDRSGQSPSLILWHLPVRYDLNQSSAFPVTLNNCLSLFNSIAWSMASNAAKTLSKVKAVTLPLSIEEKILLWSLRRAVLVQ